VFEGKTVAVVVPAYNEEAQIGEVLATMPDFVDCVLVVDDASTDRTGEVVGEHVAAEGDVPRTVLLRHEADAGAARQLARKIPGNIATVLPDRAERYFSTALL